MARRPPPGFHARRQQRQQRSFDWDHATSEGEPQAAPQSRSVGEIAQHMRRQLQADPELNDIWIEGEIRSLSRSGAGHYYFDLADADADAALACVFFRRQNRGQRVEQGDQVLLHGSADIYLPRGSLQIIVDDLRPIGAGVLQAEFERRFRMLQAEGLFNSDRKRPLPAFPSRVGVVASPSGAVWHDIQQVIARRWPLASLLLSPCLTQGAGAAESIAEGIQRLNLLTADAPEVLIVARGGGSPEDLWAYNEEQVARAIFASEIPVISAIGHETDVSIADHVADRRAPTPSAAAEIAVPDRAEEAARAGALRLTLDHRLNSRLIDLEQCMAAQRDRLQLAAPQPAAMRVVLHRQRRDLDQALDAQLTLLRGRQQAHAAQLDTLSPMRTLQRGYAIVADDGGRVVSCAAALAPRQTIVLQFADDRATARVTRITDEPTTEDS